MIHQLLTPVSITAGDILSDGTFTSNLLQDSDLSHLEYVTAYWNNPSNITDNGTLFTIRFKVNEKRKRNFTDNRYIQ